MVKANMPHQLILAPILLALLLIIPKGCHSFVVDVQTREKGTLSSQFIPVILHRPSLFKLIGTRRSCLVIPPLSLNNVEDSSSNDNDNDPNQKNTVIPNNNRNPFELASWYAVEAFGKVFGSTSGSDDDNNNTDNVQINLQAPPSSLKEALQRIKLDNERQYFLSGEVDRFAYDPDCTFADPFVSFQGRDRFIDNLKNLGSFITEYDARMVRYDVVKDETYDDTDELVILERGKKINEEYAAVVQTKVMVKLELNLPWKPILAWPWGVKYNINRSDFLITSHVESWDIDPWEGVKQIFRKPRSKIKKQT